MKFRNDQMKRIVAGLTVMLAVAVMLQCKSKDVPVVSDTDQLASYISGAGSGVDLFRPDSVIVNGTYTLSGVLFRDSVITHTRTISSLAGRLADYGVLGMVREGLATVTDIYTVRESRTDTLGTTTDTVQAGLTRYGFFLKLGDDAEPFLGWVLYGYAQQAIGGRIDMTVLGGTTTSGDSRLYTQKPESLSAPNYLKLGDMRVISKGAGVQLNAVAGAAPLVTALTDGGVYNQLMSVVDSSHCIDTVHVLTSTPKAYDFATVHYVTPANGLKQVVTVVIPYRIQP